MTQFSGPYGILATPFRKDQEIDEDQFSQNVDKLCESSLSGIVVCGSTSEFVMLTPEENCRLMTIACDTAKGRKPVICGATGADAKMSNAYLECAAKNNAAGVLVAPPYYFSYSGDEVIQFYRQLNDAKWGVPIIAYQIPQFSSPIPLEGFEQLLRMDELAGLKNSSGNIKQIDHQIQLRDQIRPDFSILTGTDDALFPCLAAGCDGSFTALGSIFPEEIGAIYQAYRSDDWSRAKQIQQMLLPVLRMADQLTFPVGYKLLAEAAGCLNTCYRQSLPESAVGQMAVLKQQMAEEIIKIRAGLHR